MKKPSVFTTFTIAILFSFVMISCSKDDDTPAVKTKTELISTSTWKFSTATANGTDVAPLLQACQKDNIITFSSAGTGIVDEGPIKCNGADPQTVPFTWSFNAPETILTVSAILFTGGNNNFTLVGLSESQLVVSQDVTMGSTTQNVVVTFTH